MPPSGVIGPPLAGYSDPPASNFIDNFVFDKLRRFRIPPSQLSSDQEVSAPRLSRSRPGLCRRRNAPANFWRATIPAKRTKLIDDVDGFAGVCRLLDFPVRRSLSGRRVSERNQREVEPDVCRLGAGQHRCQQAIRSDGARTHCRPRLRRADAALPSLRCHRARRARLWRKRFGFFSAGGWIALNATTIPMKPGARISSGGWPRSSAVCLRWETRERSTLSSTIRRTKRWGMATSMAPSSSIIRAPKWN